MPVGEQINRLQASSHKKPATFSCGRPPLRPKLSRVGARSHNTDRLPVGGRPCGRSFHARGALQQDGGRGLMDLYKAGSRSSQRMSSIALSTSGESWVLQAARSSFSCASEVTPMMVLATLQRW